MGNEPCADNYGPVNVMKLRERIFQETEREKAQDYLWNELVLLQSQTFRTVKGLEYTYQIRGNEMFVSRKTKSITKASVDLALEKIIELSVHGPEQDIEHGHVGAGIEQPLRPKQRRNEREAHIGCVGEDRCEPEDGGPAVFLPGSQGQRQHGADEDGQNAQPERGQQVVQDLLAEVHHVGVDDHGRNDQVDQQVREGLPPFRLQHTGLDGGRARPDEQKQHDDLLCADKCQFHFQIPPSHINTSMNTRKGIAQNRGFGKRKNETLAGLRLLATSPFGRGGIAKQ